MKLKFNRKQLLEAIEIGGSFSGNKKILPILEDIRVQIKENKAWILSYDNQNAIKTVCPVEADVKNGTFCINKNNLVSYISLLSDQYISIEIIEKLSSVEGEKIISSTISTDTGSVVFPCDDPNMYPKLNSDKGSDAFDIQADLLSYWINNSNQYLGDLDDMKLSMGCLNIDIIEGKVNVFASDGFKMYHDSMQLENNNITTQFGIPKNSFGGIVKALKKEDKVTIKNGENNIIIICDNTMIMVRKLEYKMPNFHSLLKYPILFKITVNKKQILNCLQKAANIHDSKYKGIVNFAFSEKGLNISSENWEGNIKMKDFIEADGGSNISINFTISYIISTINGINSENVILAVTGERQPIFIENPDEDTEIALNSPFMA